MRRVIWKFPISDSRGNFLGKIELPSGAEILKVSVQRGLPTMWCLVNPDAQTEKRDFEVFMTGQEFQLMNTYKYIDTFEVSNGMVYHLYERT